MAQRLELQALLEQLLGSRNVYFQPPSNLTMQFPCIVYERDDVSTEFAGNRPYKHMTRYRLTLISRDKEEPVHAELLALPMCVYDRYFAADLLNHDVYTLYF